MLKPVFDGVSVVPELRQLVAVKNGAYSAAPTIRMLALSTCGEKLLMNTSGMALESVLLEILCSDGMAKLASH